MSKNIIGLEKLQKKLDRLSSPSVIDKAIGQSALVVEASAKEKAPVDKGMLRQSIATNVQLGKGIATVGTPLSYAPYVEYGTGIHSKKGTGRATPWSYQMPDGKWVSTKGNKPQPFLGPALRENKSKINDVFSRILKEELER